MDARVANDRVVDVRFFPDDDDPHVTLSLRFPDGKETRMRRKLRETIGAAFARLRSTAAKRRGCGSATTAPTAAALSRDDGDVSEDVPHVDAWTEGSVMTIDGVRYRVRVNAPEVTGVVSVDFPMVGYPLAATATGTTFCEQDDVVFAWSVDGEEVGETGRFYTPTSADVGKRLVVEARGARHRETGEVCGGAATFEFSVVVSELGVDRRDATERLAPASASSSAATTYRIMTYNVLADAYSHTWSTMFPYFAKDLSKAERRLQLVCEDILFADADVVALQEVDKKWYELLFEPLLTSRGYIATEWAGKSGKTAEGCAVFFRASTFPAIVSERVIQLTKMRDANVARWIEEETNVELAKALDKITSIAQLIKVRTASGGALCVGNTHLFFHPGAMHVRVLQAHEFVRRANEHAGEDTPLVLCGDFNGEPEDGVIRYLRCGEIDASDEDWVRGSLFRWGGTSSRDAAKDIYYILDDGRGYAVDANVKVTNVLELQRLNERSIAMSLCARTLEKDWGATCKCDEVTESTSPIVDVKKHVKAGCTFKNCHKVAAFTLRRESALEPGLTMTDDDLAAARRAFADVKRAADAGLEDLTNRQRVLADSLRSDDPSSSAHPIGCGARLRIARELVSAGGFPEWTNFVGGFVGALDYVWASARDFTPRAVSPLPPLTAVTENVALPNACFPSDHVPIVVDVERRTDRKEARVRCASRG